MKTAVLLAVTIAALTFGAVSWAFPPVQVVVQTRMIRQVHDVTRWKTHTETVTRQTGIPAACGQQLWQAWANQAPVAADMRNAAPAAVPACVPYLGEIGGG